MTRDEILLEVRSLVILRMIAKRRSGAFGENDFRKLSGLDVHGLLQSIADLNKRKELQEIISGELRTTLELMSDTTCGRCGGTGLAERRGIAHHVCPCVRLELYRGDAHLPKEKMVSNEHFEGEFSKLALGDKEIIQNIGHIVQRFAV